MHVQGRLMQAKIFFLQNYTCINIWMLYMNGQDLLHQI
jgi:hypothetical protein